MSQSRPSTLETVAGAECATSSAASHFCTACQLSLPSGQEHRLHSKEQWHVNNVKRRAQSLPPISLDAFMIQTEQEAETRPKRPSRRRDSTSEDSSEPDSDDEGKQNEWPFRCLFCRRVFDATETGFAANVEHMCTTHGLFIPDQDLISDLEIFIGCLAAEVRIWHECLYCGAVKPSTTGVQSHMRAKGHCMLNLNREPELLDFWESSRVDDEPTERPTPISKTEMRFASGKVVGSRYTVPVKTTKPSKSTSITRTLPSNTTQDTSIPVGSGSAHVSGRQLARRDQMGIAGFSLQQRQVLAVAEKKAQRCEDVARRARQWVHDRGANQQKYDQIDTTGKWGKQSHKLLPR